MSAARHMLCVAAMLITFAAAGLAEAQTTTTSYPVSGSCTGGGQLCNNIVTLPVTTTGVLQVQFVGGPLLCSNIRMHLYVDGTEVAVTPFVGASGTTGFFNLGPVTPGTHNLGLQAEGQLGGCNSGNLVSWAGTAQVTTGTGSVPTLSEWGLVALLALLALAGARTVRRRDRPV